MKKIYTKQGDGGFTQTITGEHVSKVDAFIAIYGSLDELNAFLGFAAEALRTNKDFTPLYDQLLFIQRSLFSLVAALNSPAQKLDDIPGNIKKLENEIDAMSETLPELRKFILPGGGEIAIRFHLARVVCRRVERELVRMYSDIKFDQAILAYMNRLSDWLFIASRFVAIKLKIPEIS